MQGFTSYVYQNHKTLFKTLIFIHAYMRTYPLLDLSIQGNRILPTRKYINSICIKNNSLQFYFNIPKSYIQFLVFFRA